MPWQEFERAAFADPSPRGVLRRIGWDGKTWLDEPRLIGDDPALWVE